MRRPRLSFATSKATLLLLVVATGISFGIVSCSKDDSTKENPGVTQDQAASVVSQTFVNQGGITEQLGTATTAVVALQARKADGGKLSDFCGKSTDGSISHAGTSEGVSYDYKLSWLYTLACNGTAPNAVPYQFTFTFNGKTSIETSKFATVDSATAKYYVRGLGETSPAWEVSQTFDRAGKFVSKTTDLPSFTSAVHYESSNIKIDKQSHEIVSGTATVKITGADSKGNAFKYEGTITFQGNKKAVFAVTGGSNFNLNW
ncbi:hypothetical protein [Chitinophaga ginsengisoli]|uniref:Lipoprotein n=1 Tax=Chitinophaga ginsengisoli TaxID=363837 RepID=A0A2P8FPJ7_9BACT|nr:hypothetical protein [Chitinophaga ginsengisoli]PSL23656.1 hypothetical protein CLV42_11710 [Chitinophaga ginsengisoli]